MTVELRYKYVENELIHRIKSGQYPIGSKLPNSKQLCAELDVSEITVRRALSEIAKTGLIERLSGKGTYVSNKKAKHYRRKTATVSLIIPQLGISSFYSEILSGVEEEAFKRNLKLLLYSTRESVEREALQLDRILGETPDGTIFISHSNYSEHFCKLEKLTKSSFLTTVDVPINSLSCDHVSTDNETGTSQAVRHLVESGKKRLVLLTKSVVNTIMAEREKHFLNATEAFGTSIAPSMIVHVENDDSRVFSKVTELLNSTNPPDAILATTEKFAIQAYEAIRNNGKRLPNEIALIGFGSEVGLEVAGRQLGGVIQPASELGRKAVTLLAEKIDGSQMKQREIILPVSFQPGSTC